MKTWEAARGHWLEIFNHFGLHERHFTGKHCPCPICGGRDRFRFDNKDERGTWICNACGAGHGVQLILNTTDLNYRQVMDAIDDLLGNNSSIKTSDYTGHKINYFIQQNSYPLNDLNPVRRYLKSRNLRATKNIRYCPSVQYFDDGQLVDSFPAMVVPFTSPGGKLVSHHCTYLTQQGTKAPVSVQKKILSAIAPLAGGAIRLTDVYSHIGIAEGVENALAVTDKYDVPCWACGTADLLASFSPPHGVHSITIYGDNDKNFKGQRSVYQLANRLYQLYDVEVELPPEPGVDFAQMVER